MITIRIVDSKGNGVSGADVRITWGMTTSSSRTDWSGYAQIDTDSRGYGRLYVNGTDLGSQNIYHGGTFTLY
jgi:hypothetical protein